MKIIFITNSLGFGGAEKMVTFIANSLLKRGHIISIINFNSIGQYINEFTQKIENDIDVFVYSNSKSKYKLQDRINKIKFTYRIVKEKKPDIIIGFTTFPNYVGKIVGSYLRIPAIMSERGNPYITINIKNLHSILELLVINHSEGAVFQIEGAAKFYSKKLQARSIIIPNPVFIKTDIEHIPINKREKTIVSVGRLDNFQKRYDIMIKAFSIFSRNHSDYILKLYGAGSDTEKIKYWSAIENVEDKVKFMGVTKEPMKSISHDGIFLITSDFEGISNALLEAMAVGLPCVSTDSSPGGAQMLINNKENGILCPIQDPVAIATAISEFADNEQLADYCGQNAMRVTKRFEINKIIDLWENYITAIIKKYELTKAHCK